MIRATSKVAHAPLDTNADEMLICFRYYRGANDLRPPGRDRSLPVRHESELQASKEEREDDVLAAEDEGRDARGPG